MFQAKHLHQPLMYFIIDISVWNKSNSKASQRARVGHEVFQPTTVRAEPVLWGRFVFMCDYVSIVMRSTPFETKD